MCQLSQQKKRTHDSVLPPTSSPDPDPSPQIRRSVCVRAAGSVQRGACGQLLSACAWAEAAKADVRNDTTKQLENTRKKKFFVSKKRYVIRQKIGAFEFVRGRGACGGVAAAAEVQGSTHAAQYTQRARCASIHRPERAAASGGVRSNTQSNSKTHGRNRHVSLLHRKNEKKKRLNCHNRTKKPNCFARAMIDRERVTRGDSSRGFAGCGDGHQVTSS